MGLTVLDVGVVIAILDGNDAMPARVEPASRAIGAAAAALRALLGPSLKLPEALVVATAQVLRADRIITTDQGWPTVGIPIDVVASGRKVAAQ